MKILPHNWIASTVGHGEKQCSNCRITNREADAIGSMQCANYSQAEQKTIIQSKWFVGYFQRQLSRLDKLDGRA